MEQDCKICGSSLNLEDFEPKSDIYQIMEKEHLCFSCAFWTWRFLEDKKLQRLHDDKDLRLAKLRREEASDTDPWDAYKQSAKTLLAIYPDWYFGRPIILEGNHYIYHSGKILNPQKIDSYHTYILMDDGTIYPFVMGLYDKIGITHQGKIPVKFLIPWDNNKVFENNAILLSNLDIEELKARGMKTPFINQPNKVPEKIVKMLFEKFYNQ